MPQSDKKPKIANLNLIAIPPALATDGSGIKIFPNGDTEILFFQVVEKKENQVKARGISNIRMSFDQLKQLQATINKAIENEKKRGK